MLDFVKAILESNKNEEGIIDISKAMIEINKEAPKNVINKATFNDKLEDLKQANLLVEELKTGSKDIEELQTKITDYESQVETLKTERAEEKKSYTLKEKLKDAGAVDIDYMIYKLGDVEVDENGEIRELDNKIKDLMESNSNMFKVADNEALEEPKIDDKGFKVLDNGLDDGNEPDAITTAKSNFEDALGISKE